MSKRFRQFTIQWGGHRLHGESDLGEWGRDLRLSWGRRLLTVSWRPRR